MIQTKYEIKQFSVSWNATTASQKVNLNSDFSRHGLITGVSAHIFPDGLVSSYNDADCAKMYSTYAYIGWELKYRTKVVMSMYGATSDAIKRVNYSNNVNMRRNGHFPPQLWNVIGSDSASHYYIPMCLIDLSSVEVNDPDNEKIVGGVDNNTSDMEITFYNTVGAFTTSATLNVALEYKEIYMMDKKTGKLNLVKA
jgi:hypothetical protein